MRIYAIGDIHGYRDRLEQAHEAIEKDRAKTGDATAPVIHLGDLTDRGPESKGVIEFILAGRAEGQPWHVLKGNHDRMFAGFLTMPGHHDPRLFTGLHWLHPRLGGNATLASYGILDAARRNASEVQQEAMEIVPAAHRDFLDALTLTYETEELFFAHAGIRPGVALDRQDEEDLVWIRHEFVDDPRDHGKLIVHGHTALDQPEHYGNRVNLDGGAGYGRPLHAAVFEERDVWLLSPGGRTRLNPVA